MSVRRTQNEVFYTASIRKSSHADVEDYFSILSYQDYRNDVLIDRPEDYEMSIVKFLVDTPSLPVYIAEIQPNQADPWKTIYQVTLSYVNGGVENYYSKPVIFSQRDFSDFAPSAPNSNPKGLQSNTRAYNSYSYTDLIEDINQALINCKVDLDAAFPALSIYDSPQFVWDPINNRANVYGRLDSYEESLGVNRINCYMSKSLYPLFSSLPVFKYKVSSNRTEYRLKFADLGNNVQDNFFGIQSGIICQQEHSTLEQWCPYNSLVFTSNLLPIYPEHLAPAIIYDEKGNVIPLNDNLTNFSPIITDISGLDFSMRSHLSYLPTAEYRFISLTGNTPLNKLDFQVYLLTKLGILLPFHLHANSSAYIKILFRRKKF